MDVLIVNPVDSSAITPAVKDANDAGIPVITVDRSSDGGKVLTLVASNSTKGGQMAAKFMIDKLGQDAKLLNYRGFQVPAQRVNVVKGLMTRLKANLILSPSKLQV